VKATEQSAKNKHPFGPSLSRDRHWMVRRVRHLHGGRLLPAREKRRKPEKLYSMNSVYRPNTERSPASKLRHTCRRTQGVPFRRSFNQHSTGDKSAGRSGGRDARRLVPPEDVPPPVLPGRSIANDLYQSAAINTDLWPESRKSSASLLSAATPCSACATAGP